MDSLLGLLDAEVSRWLPRLVELRRDIHRHPELGFEEVRTQALVRTWLEEHGYAARASAGTGLVADLEGREDLHPAHTIALRADLDALPMDEETALPYRSVHPGRAHKCGHDGHTTILMGVAALLAQHRGRLPGRVRFLFQPAEEGVAGGGAKPMIDEGALEGVREVYGLHNWPAFPRGELRVISGPTMAQVHGFKLTVEGVGGHGSQPQLCRDPIVAGAHLVTALQTLVSRELGYDGGAVVSVCVFRAGSAGNVIPSRALLEGTIRTFSAPVTARVLERFRAVVDGVASTFGVEISLELKRGYPVVSNDPTCFEAVKRVGARVLGSTSVSSAGLPLAAGEDFAYMAEEVPGAYFFLGAGVPGKDTPVCHHPDFDFDDELISIGMRMFLGLVVDRLEAWSHQP